MNEKMQEELSGTRLPLADRLPLDAPMSLQLGVTNACNLKCEFCEHSSSKFQTVRKRHLEYGIVEKLVRDIEKRGKKPNQILLTGIGEPLLNPRIVDIVKLLSQSKVTDRVGIITNGTLLKEALGEQLIDAGLNVLRVSLNGLSDSDYKRYTGVSIDFDSVYRQLKHFYQIALDQRSGKAADIKVYIKIMDYMLEENPEKETGFRERFGPICDILNIERLNNASPDVDYEKFGVRDFEMSRRGLKKEDATVCPRTFYEAVLSHEGNILACCHDFWYAPNQLIMGNLETEDFIDIWNGKKYNDLRVNLLKGELKGFICNGCSEYKGLMTQEDNLDGRRGELMAFYEKR